LSTEPIFETDIEPRLILTVNVRRAGTETEIERLEDLFRDR
jgi:hypothetical protein